MGITVVDSIMGSGKSTWARKYMNSHPEKRWLFVTPYLKEFEKAENECLMIALYEPTVGHIGSHNKSEDLVNLINKGKSIVTTHSLFLRIKHNNELLDSIRDQQYNLIIDETLDVVRHEKLNKDDIHSLVSYNACFIDQESKILYWTKDDYKGTHRELKEYAETGNIYSYQDQALIWLYNPQIFSAFESVFLLTYLFEGSRMRCYFDFYDIQYEHCFVRAGEIVKGCTKDGNIKKELVSLIDIYHGSLNDDFEGKHSYYYLSRNWFNSKKNQKLQYQLQKNAYNYLHNIRKAKSGKNGDALYTTFLDVHNKTPLISYKKSFLQCSQRSTTEYADKTNLAYLINVFEDPEITNFFSEHNISYNESMYALNSMIQWIWRSAIRERKPIHIYIPSQRMRELLIDWLNDQ